ncbi:ornithine carbamoyltransferase [bacterium]|nr:ornithine carbamoyltransferase [bacterium]
MITHNFRGRDFLTLMEFSREEVETILEVALDLKKKFALGEPHRLLQDKSLFMLFYNQSLRTRNSFEAGMTQLGGHAHFLDPKKIYTPALEGDEEAYSTERVSDVARVLSRMGHGISIRIYGEPVNWIYGKAHRVLREFARWSEKPVINMECDKYHPCQALADILTIKEKYGNELRNRKFVMSWAYSPSIEKPLSVPQSAIIGASFTNLNIVLAHPKGFELDPEVLEFTKQNSQKNGGTFEICNDMRVAFQDADIVYPKSWTSFKFLPPNVGEPQLDQTKVLYEANRDWICDENILTVCNNNVIYMHCLPCDRGFEVTNDVIDGRHSVVFDQAENRLHVQKAVMALTM